jgi:hypothetical protein
MYRHEKDRSSADLLPLLQCNAGRPAEQELLDHAPRAAAAE